MRDPVVHAQGLLGLPPTGQGHAHAVWRLDQAAAYQLVCTAGQLACVDEASGGLLASAKSPIDPVALTASQARDRAGLGVEAAARLVWAPSAATRSMFDPVWEISSGGSTRFVDQRGRVWHRLMPIPGSG